MPHAATVSSSPRWSFSLLVVASLAIAGCASSDEGEDDADLETDSVEEALVIGGFVDPTSSEKDAAVAKWSHVDPNHVVPSGLLRNALGFFERNRSRIDNESYIGVIDFSKHSGKKRFWVIDMDTGAVEPHVVAHGSGSDPSYTGYAKYFSNTSGSNKSSLGYYLTAETYTGKHGYSLRLDGLSDTNSRVRSRAIVIHGASYVEAGRSKQGRSWGCPAVPEGEKYDIIKKLKGGAVIYAERSSVID